MEDDEEDGDDNNILDLLTHMKRKPLMMNQWTRLKKMLQKSNHMMN
jgi:hypothetical protein